MQRPAFSQSPKRVGSGPSRPPISRGGAGSARLAAAGSAVGEASAAFLAERIHGDNLQVCQIRHAFTTLKIKANSGPEIAAAAAANDPDAHPLGPAARLAFAPNDHERIHPEHPRRPAARSSACCAVGGRRRRPLPAGPAHPRHPAARRRPHPARRPATRRRGASSRCCGCARPTTRSTHCCPPTCSSASHARCDASCCAPRWICRSPPTCSRLGRDAALSTTLAIDGYDATRTMSPSRAGATELVSFDYAPGRQVIAAPGDALRAITGLSLSNVAAAASSTSGWAPTSSPACRRCSRASSEAFVPQMLNLDLLDGDQLQQGLLHGTGNRRPHAAPRAHQAPHVPLSAVRRPDAAAPLAGLHARRHQGRGGA